MTSYPCEIEGFAAVLIGNFNPSIIQPAWLAHHQLIREDEFKTAEVEIIRPEITIFRTGCLILRVLPERFQVDSSTGECLGPMKDFVVGIFRLLEHTPIAKFGINRNMHFRTPSAEAWHKVGHQLVPKELWQDLIDEPGTRSVTVSGKRHDSQSKFFRATVEPSVKIEHGVFVGTNEHFEVASEPAAGNQPTIDLLASQWEESLRFSKQVAESIISKCLEERS